MHLSLFETQRMQHEASFSKLTRRARRMARTTKKQSKIKDDFVEKDFKKLTYRARQIARRAQQEPSARQQSVPASRTGQAVASSTIYAPYFGLGDTVAMTSGNSWLGPSYATITHLAQHVVTSPLVDSQIEVPVMICPVPAIPQSLTGQMHAGRNFQPCSNLLLTAFAMGAAWATRPVPYFASSGIGGFPPGSL